MILTKKETLEQHVGLWAIPKSSDCMEPGEFPFRYEIYGVGTHPTHWRDAAIFLGTHHIFATIPEGVDLYAKCLETLDHQAKDAMATYSQRMQEIDRRRESLLMLAHTPEPVTLIDGVELCDD